MKRITLKKMKLKNFKGVRSLELDFGKTTSVYGRNGTGKTTIYDAFTWVLFNKDSRDSGSFQVATNDQDGRFIPRLEHEVSITLDIDGEVTTLTKSIADKWVTQRGTTTPELKGWESSYKINEVPCKKGDFDKFVAGICGYETFKMVTMPGYFMTKPKEERRTLLLNMAGGEILPKAIIDGEADLEAVIKVLENRTYEEANKRMKAEKSKYKKERDELSTSITTLNSSIRRDLPTIEEVEAQINDNEQRIREIDTQISDRTRELRSAQQHNRERQAEVLMSSREYDKIVNLKIAEAQKRKSSLEANISMGQMQIRDLQNTIAYLKSQSDQQLEIFNEKAAIREEIKKELIRANAETFRITEDEVCCPTCGRMFEGDMLAKKGEELRLQFNERKTKRLMEIQNRGKANSALRDQAQQQNARILADIAAKRQAVEEMKGKVESWEKELAGLTIPTEEQLKSYDTDVVAAFQRLKNLSEHNETELPTVDVSDLQNQQQEIRTRQGELNQTLAEIRRNNADKEKILAVEKRINDISAAIAQLELMEDQLIRYSRKRAMMLEEKVNRMFTMVTFKFLIDQINGGIDEVCEPYYNGSPYTTNLNNGARINAGIDICTAIAKYYGIEAPIFVDNAEASNTFIPTETQLVKLIVSTDNELRIENND